MNGNFYLRDFFKKPLLVGFDNRPAHDQRGVTMGAHQRRHTLQFLEKKCDGAKANDIRLILPQDAQKSFVVRAGERRLDDAHFDAGKRRADAGGQIHETDGWNMHLVGHGRAHPLVHVVAFNQQYSGGFHPVAGQHGLDCS